MTFRRPTCGSRDGTRACVDCAGDEHDAPAPVLLTPGHEGAAGAGAIFSEDSR